MNRPAWGGAPAVAPSVPAMLATAFVAAACLIWAPEARSAQPVTAPVQSFLHAGAPGGPTRLNQIRDSRERTVLLKGVNVDGIVDYFRDDLGPPYPSDPASYSGGAC